MCLGIFLVFTFLKTSIVHNTNFPCRFCIRVILLKIDTFLHIKYKNVCSIKVSPVNKTLTDKEVATLLENDLKPKEDIPDDAQSKKEVTDIF